MSLSRIIKRVWYGPPLIRSAGELAPGKALVEGTAVAGKKTILSPLTSTTCIAYKYRASYLTPSRTQGTAERVLKEAEVYSPVFEVDLEDGKIKVVPEEQGEFDREEHKKLQSGTMRGFSANEVLIKPGARIRVTGKVKKGDGGSLVLESKKIEIVDEEPKSPAERKRSREQTKKKKKRKKG